MSKNEFPKFPVFKSPFHKEYNTTKRAEEPVVAGGIIREAFEATGEALNKAMGEIDEELSKEAKKREKVL